MLNCSTPEKFKLTEERRQELIGLARAAVHNAICRIRNFYNMPHFPDVEVDFSLQGEVAGMANVNTVLRTCTIRVNLQLLSENEQDYLSQTIPHELAHFVTFLTASLDGRQKTIKPHGPEWQNVMRLCFGLTPETTHSYKTTPARVHKRAYEYMCDCKSFFLTTRMHNSILKGRQRRCLDCNAFLTFLSQVDESATAS